MSRPTSSLTIFQQVVTVLGVFLFQTITPISFRCAAQTLPENVPRLNQAGVVGVWIWNNTNPYSPVSDFRNETNREYYTVWPEDIPGHSFQYPCEDRASKLMLENFTYPGSGGLIQTVQYFDLGIVKHYRPYWIRPTQCLHCWYWDKRPGWTPIYCERGDVSNLYMSRAMSTILQGLRFGVVMVLIQLAAFVVLAILIPVYFQNRSQSFRRMAPSTIIQRLQCLNWGATFVESLHLLALAVAGFLLVEGYGHTGDWRAWSMNTLAYYYRVQTACAFVASLLRQCANSITSNLTVQSGNNAYVQTEEEKKKKKEKEEQEEKEKKKKLPLEMLIGQVVVCVVMVEYLYLTDDEYLDFLIQVVFGVVTVAVTFTMSTVIEVGASSLWLIVKALWRSIGLT